MLLLYDALGVGTIVDDDATPSLSLSNDVTVTEGTGNSQTIFFNVTLSAPSRKPVSVKYDTIDVTANAGSDYVGVSGTLYFPAESTTQRIAVAIYGDSDYEPDETFLIRLSNASNVALNDSERQCKIINDDSQPIINIDDAFVTEGNSGTTTAVFTLRTYSKSYQTMSVDFATADDTANSGSDYIATSGGVTFAPGQTVATIPVLINGDSIPELVETLKLNFSNPTNASLSRNQATGYLLNDDEVSPGSMIISEFRLRGAMGALDEFVELYNATDAPLLVTTTDGSNGWMVRGSDGISRFRIPIGTTIPAHGHYLGVNSAGYSLSSYPAGSGTTAIGDATYTRDIADDTGLALFRSANASNFTLANRLDAVGFDLVTNALYKEANGIQHIGSADGEYTFVRKVSSTTFLPQDTDDNAADFNFVSTTSGSFNTVPSILGAPGPENLASPIARNSTIATSLIDPTAPRLAAPNFVRVGSGNSGTISIRRQFTNQTGATVTRLRFRIIDITTLGSPVITPPQAQLRLTDSGDETVFTNFGPLTIKGTGLEYPTQSSSGGLNTSMNVALPNEGLAAGASTNVQFLMNVAQNGHFRFYISIEALP